MIYKYYKYIQQTVLAAKLKFLVKCLFLVIDKKIYQKSSYGSDVSSETYPPRPPHPKTSKVYLTPPPPP